jgi:hypothetical protein
VFIGHIFRINKLCEKLKVKVTKKKITRGYGIRQTVKLFLYVYIVVYKFVYDPFFFFFFLRISQKDPVTKSTLVIVQVYLRL